MTKIIDVESVVEAPEAAPQTENQIVAELIIRVFENGNMEVNVPEGGRELQPFEVETLTRSVSEQMRDSRIAQQAVAMFKAKLG